jgi:tryptophan-rich sensory protein
MALSNRVKLVLSLAIPQVVAAIGAYFTITGTGSWYMDIDKPSWNPPSWVFGPTWTILYVLMGVAFFLVWKERVRTTGKRAAMIAWVVQLLLNVFWTIIFFNRHAIGWALVEIAALWLAIVLTIILFLRVNRTAALLLLPYLAWVTFATILTSAIWKLNGGSD